MGDKVYAFAEDIDPGDDTAVWFMTKMTISKAVDSNYTGTYRQNFTPNSEKPVKTIVPSRGRTS